MLSVLALHSVIPFMQAVPDGLKWAFAQPDPTAWADHLFVVLRSVGTVMFTLIAGSLFTHLCRRDGPWATLTRRWTRLGASLCAAGLTMLPATYLVWLWGWTRQGHANPRSLWYGRWEPGYEETLYGPAQLWYLEYLLIITTLAAILWIVFKHVRPFADGRGGTVRSLIWLAGAGAGAGLIVAQWPDTVNAFRNTPVPMVGRLTLHTWMFLVGMVASGSGELRRATALWPAALAAAGALLTIYFLRRSHWPEAMSTGVRAGYVALAAAGALGLCLRLPVSIAPTLRRRLDAASFTVYLTHLPSVAGTAVLLGGRLPGPLVAAASFAVGLTLTLMLHWVVSRVPGGWMLGGAARTRYPAACPATNSSSSTAPG